MPPESNDSTSPELDLARAVRFCADLPEMMAGLAEIYRRADAETSASTCLGGGGCCRFDLAGHRLYVSTGELALLTLRNPPNPEPLPLRCAYQDGPRCTARGRRPLGCRVFFCRRKDGEGAAGAYEACHELIRRLHDHCGAQYAYMELTEALRELHLCREKAVDIACPGQ